MPSADEPAMESAMNNEELAILWKALRRVPAIYREPLILYYREGRSIEHVAVSLELTEDAVKQRLSRGRRVLQERVANFVEGALARSTPGRVFTVGVLAALPALSPPAKAAGVGAAVAQGAWLAKGASFLPMLLSSASGMMSAVMAFRAHLDQSRTPRERRAIVRITITLCAATFGWLAALYLARAGALRWPDLRLAMAWLAQGLVLAGAVGWPLSVLRTMRNMRALRSDERRLRPELFQDPRDRVGSAAGVYRSRWTLFGVPLVHVRFASTGEGEGPVFGWIAGGDRAYGLLFAWGGWAVAPVSVGAVARPDHAAEERQLVDVVREAIQSIDPEFRQLVVLRDVEDLAYEDIAEVTGLNVGTVKSRIHRGRAQLREKVERLIAARKKVMVKA